MKKNIMVIPAILLLFLVSCEKELEDVLPAITTSGANTFGCIIDGRVFAIEKKCNYRSIFFILPCASIDISHYGNFYFTLNAKSDRFIEQQIVEIYINAKLDTTTTQVIQIMNSSLSIKKESMYQYYELDTSQINELKFLNSNPKYVSGIFNLHFINYEGQKKVMSEGRFDIEQ